MAAAFTLLGLSIDAVVLRSLDTERLATLALVAKTMSAEIEPEVHRLAAAAARLQDCPDATVGATAHDIAGAAARIHAAVDQLDRPFRALARKRHTAAGERRRELRPKERAS